jgi:hypothetical protein
LGALIYTSVTVKQPLYPGFSYLIKPLPPGFLQIQSHPGHPSYTMSYLRVLCASFCAFAVKWTF